MMKKNIILFILLCVVGFSSCDFLDVEPTDVLSVNEYLNSEANANSAIAGIYNVMLKDQLYGQSLWFDFEIGNDEAHYCNWNSAGVKDLKSYDFDATHSSLAEAWSALYDGINRANAFLYNAKLIENRQHWIIGLEGEAYFLRALYYFNLVTRWGDVPLKLEPSTSALDDNNYIGRTPSQKVYDQIYTDLDSAIDKLPEFTTSSHASKSAAMALKARACIHNAGYPLNNSSKWQIALDLCKSIQETKTHSLNLSYNDVFLKLASDKYDLDTKEILFEVEFKGNFTDGYRMTSRLGNAFGIACDVATKNFSYGKYAVVSLPLYRLYPSDNSDVRKERNIATYYYDSNVKKVGYKIGSTTISKLSDSIQRPTAKWRRDEEVVMPQNKNYGPINFPLLRYADVLLMRAEAENEVNKTAPTQAAKDAMKLVRGRSVQGDDPIKYETMDYAEFKQLIEDERARELCFEGLRKYDLIRWNKMKDNMANMATIYEATSAILEDQSSRPWIRSNISRNICLNFNNRHLLYPIPQAELSMNGNVTGKQNPGW